MSHMLHMSHVCMCVRVCMCACACVHVRACLHVCVRVCLLQPFLIARAKILYLNCTEESNRYIHCRRYGPFSCRGHVMK